MKLQVKPSVKVALQISGMQRYGLYFPYLLQALHRAYGSVDIFAHHWEGPYSLDEIREKCGPERLRALQIEPRREFPIDPAWKVRPEQTPIYNVVSMVASIKAANDLRRMHEALTGEHYDLAIRARSDILLDNMPLDPAWALAVPEGTIRLGARPEYLRDMPLAVQDQIAFARPADMDRYSELYDNLPAFHAEDPENIYHPESYFGWSLRKSGLVIEESGFRPLLERAHLHPRDRATY